MRCPVSGVRRCARPREQGVTVHMVGGARWVSPASLCQAVCAWEQGATVHMVGGARWVSPASLCHRRCPVFDGVPGQGAGCDYYMVGGALSSRLDANRVRVGPTARDTASSRQPARAPHDRV